MSPKLAQTACMIHVQVVHVVDMVALAFENAKLSIRGSIRKAPNVITWMGMLRKLTQSGAHNAQALIKQWNDQASKDHKLTGAKMTSLVQLLSLSEVCMDALEQFIGMFGWESSPFSEHSL